jgi:hypothetical protein
VLGQTENQKHADGERSHSLAKALILGSSV